MRERYAFCLGSMVAFSAMLAPLTLALAQLHMDRLALRIEAMGLASVPGALLMAWMGRRHRVLDGAYVLGSALVLGGTWGATLYVRH